ncbi:MAG TPA: DUF4173 domain-containing protein [Terriglobia bacterium]|nr:DUF4173 domain-containing protein [Terriglobia bacterium]
MENAPAKSLEVVVAAIAAGISGDALLRAGSPGINVFLWAALLVGLVVFLARGRPIVSVRDDAAAAGALLLFAAGFAWRAAPLLLLLDLFALGVVVSLAALRVPVVRLRASSLGEYVRGAFLAAVHIAFGPLLLVFKDLDWKGDLRTTRFRRAVAVAGGLMLGVPLLLLFGSLLMGADAVFASLVRRTFHLDFLQLFSHLFLILFFAWIVGGFLRGIFFFDPGSVSLPPAPKRFGLGITEIAVALGAVDALFLAFVSVQFRYFFGGAGLVDVMPGMTYAEYARHGFFELVAVSALVLPLLLGTHWLLRNQTPRAKGIFRMVAGIQVALVFVIMGSAVERMRLYQQAYGLTELRIYTTAFMAWLAVVFVWLVLTVFRGRRERFTFGAMVAGFCAVLALNVINPDALIARVNARRAAEGHSFDADYVHFLSADAVPALIDALPELAAPDRCAVARTLLDRWSGPRSSGWRSWNYSRFRARAAVTEHKADLERLGNLSAACP